MTKLKRGLIISTMVLALGATSLTAFAASNTTAPAKNSAVCTDENKAERLQDKKDILAEKVKAGTMTQARADEILAAIEANQATCDGTGSAKIGQKYGAGFGGMRGEGKGSGEGRGERTCNGTGEGRGNSQGERGQRNCGNCQG